jgi:hypothetical protein
MPPQADPAAGRTVKPQPKPNAGPSPRQKKSKNAQDQKARKDAPQDAAKDFDAEEDELDDRAAEKADAGRLGAHGAKAWLAERIADQTLSLSDRIDVALTLEAAGNCRGFGSHVEWITAVCDALTVEAVAKLPVADRIRAALVRVESYRLSGMSEEKAPAQALLNHVAANLAGMAGADFTVDLALLARQARVASLDVPETLAAHVATSGTTNLVAKLLSAKATAADKQAAQAELAKPDGDHFERSLLSALTGLSFDRSGLWAGQDAKTGMVGSAAQTLRRLRAMDAEYWVAQGPN